MNQQLLSNTLIRSRRAESAEYWPSYTATLVPAELYGNDDEIRWCHFRDPPSARSRQLRPISRGIIAKIFRIDSSRKRIRAWPIREGGKPFPLSPSSCRSLRARGWRRARDPVRRLAKTLPHLPHLPPFHRLISTDFHNGSMYEYVRSILAPGYFPLTYRPS